MPTTHTDPHTLPHCGQCNLDFETDQEMFDHKENVEHEVVGVSQCANPTCKKPTEFREVRKQVPGEIHPVFCDDCLKGLAIKHQQRETEKKNKT